MKVCRLLALYLTIGSWTYLPACSAVTSRVAHRTLRLYWLRLQRPSEGNGTEAALQYLLRRKGFYKGEPDGFFGIKTEQSVKAFQKAHGLKADGVVGAETWQKLIMRLKRGARGDAVRAVQSIFTYSYSEGGPAVYDIHCDGVFGNEMEKAVQAFQKEAGLRGDGVVGTQTWCALVGYVS